MSASGHTEPKADAASARIVVHHARHAALGRILLAIASLWLAVPAVGWLTGEMAIVPGLGNSGAYWAGIGGVGFAVIALHWMVRRETVVVDRGVVVVTSRSLFRRRAWREPLASYREIRGRQEQRPHRYGARRWHVIELWHPEPAKVVELARAKDPREAEAFACAWARRLAVPLRRESFEHSAPAEPETRDESVAEAAPGRALPAAWSATLTDPEH